MELIRKTQSRTQPSGGKRRNGIFKCPRCGDQVEKLISNGIKSKTCGCLSRERYHGMHGSKLHKLWDGMKQRCLNKKHQSYMYYGGRGIIVCNEWLEFKPFYVWALSNGYREDLQIDRRENEGNYTQENCRFVTSAINNQNRSSTKLSKKDVSEIRHIYKKGQIKQKDIAKLYMVSGSMVNFIVKNKRWKENA